MKENGKMIKDMDLERKPKLMGILMKASLKIMSNLVMEHILMSVEKNMLEILKMDNIMGREHIILVQNQLH